MERHLGREECWARKQLGQAGLCLLRPSAASTTTVGPVSVASFTLASSSAAKRGGQKACLHMELPMACDVPSYWHKSGALLLGYGWGLTSAQLCRELWVPGHYQPRGCGSLKKLLQALGLLAALGDLSTGQILALTCCRM